jgi:DNA-binding transcriptional LysR family regulator
MNLELLKMFYTIARAGNLTKAAQILNTSQSSLSRSMQLFEHQMKAKLFKRHPRGLYLTLEGEKVFKHASRLMQENEDFIKSFHNNDDEIKGEIKIITTPYLAENELTASLLSFLEENPELRIDIITTIDDFDLENADIAIRSFIPYRPELEQLFLLTHHHKLWANAKYLEKFGTPQSPEDLDNHRLIAFGLDKQKNFSFTNWLNWLLYIGNNSDQPRKPFFRVSSHGGILKAGCEGYGVIQFPQEWVRLKSADLVEILPDLQAPTVELYYIFNKKSTSSKTIRALYKYLHQRLLKVL